MRAIIASEPGGPEVLRLVDLPMPEYGPTEVLIRVHAAGLNRADLLQRQGFYPPPPGASDVLGMEVSGVVVGVGELVRAVEVGTSVVALVTSGGYADHCVAAAAAVLPLPTGLTFEEGAALPEVVATVWSNLFMVAGLQPDEWVLIHGGGSGVGTMAIQLAHAAGAHVVTTVGSSRKATACQALGADIAINYRTDDFVPEVAAATQGRGVDVVLDLMGAAYLERNLAALAPDGRLVIIGLQGGTTTTIDLSLLLARRLSVVGTSLRSRPLSDKALIFEQLRDVVWPLLANGSVRPVVSNVFDLADVVAAHEALAAGDHIGKIILRVEA